MLYNEYMTQHNRLRGHFYVRVGEYIHDVIWELEPYARELKFGKAWRYRDSGHLRFYDTDSGAPPEVTQIVDQIKFEFDLWRKNLIDKFDVTHLMEKYAESQT